MLESTYHFQEKKYICIEVKTIGVRQNYEKQDQNRTPVWTKEQLGTRWCDNISISILEKKFSKENEQ